MIKTRQKNIKIFEINGGETLEIIEFLKKNFVLFRGHLLVFKDKLEPSLVEFLDELKLAYIVSEDELKGKETQGSDGFALNNKTEIFNRNIRSGEEVESSGSLIIAGNVNNGALISAEGDIFIFGKCEGVIVCGGECLVLKNLVSSHIVFQGEILDEKTIQKINAKDCLKIITKNADNLSIKEIL